MDIKKFHIYVADLNPRYGKEPGKVRPVVVVQTDLLNNAHPSTIVCPLTAKIVKHTRILRVHLSRTETELKEDSDILVDQIRAIDNRRFRNHIGELSRRHRRQLLENLMHLVIE